jgi:hypothetical protein
MFIHVESTFLPVITFSTKSVELSNASFFLQIFGVYYKKTASTANANLINMHCC